MGMRQAVEGLGGIGLLGFWGVGELGMLIMGLFVYSKTWWM